MKALISASFGAFAVLLAAVPVFASPFGTRVADSQAPALAHVTVSLPLRNEAELETLLRLQSDPASPEHGHFLTTAQFRARYGPSVATIRAVGASLRSEGLRIDGTSTQMLRVSGAPRAMARAFGTTLEARRFAREPEARFVATSPLHLDATLRGAGAYVLGLRSFQPRITYSKRVKAPTDRYSAQGLYWFTDFKQAYAFPSAAAANGTGATIGIVMSNDVRDSDVNAYFNHEKYAILSGKANPAVTRVKVDGGGLFNADLSEEGTLDVEVSLGGAPGAKLLYYNVPNLNDNYIADAYTEVVEQNAADVISSSFGACELYYTKAYNGGVDGTQVFAAERQLFMQGNAQGQTFVASSGDNAGLGCTTTSYIYGHAGTYTPGVSDPASDPNVTAVGGTNLITTVPPSPQPSPAKLKSAYVRESEFADPLMTEDPFQTGGTVSGGYFGSGSGASAVWPQPDTQKVFNTGTTMRAVPDISMQMGGCPYDASSCGPDDSGTLIVEDGQIGGVVGTSSSSPQFAGMLAVRIGAFGQRLGNVNPAIYALAMANRTSSVPLLHTTIPGYNGIVTVPNTSQLYNPIVGVGTPVTENLIGLSSDALSGNPQTASNP